MQIDKVLSVIKNIFIIICFIVLALSVFNIIDYKSPFAKMAEEMIERQTGVDIVFPDEKFQCQEQLKECLK